MDLASITDDISANDLTDAMMQYWGIKTDAELARELNIEDRRKVGQYRTRKGKDDIQYKMIVALLRDIGYLERKLAATQSAANPDHSPCELPTTSTSLCR